MKTEKIVAKNLYFTITEGEIREVAEEIKIPKTKLTNQKIKEVFDYVEFDQVLWRQITNSIKSALIETI